jgi:DNA-binding MarR family transcriptional regulator
MKNASVLPVIALWEEFLQKNKNANVESFARWIIKEKTNEPGHTTSKQPGQKKAGAIDIHEELNETAKALLLITRLHRILQKNTKPILKKIGFAKDHEYGVLIQIYLLNNPNKKEVANELLLENSTTVEMIKRLVKRGFIKEVVNTEDKRAMRLSLTEKGKQKLYESYAAMEKIYANFLVCLTDTQKKELVKLLDQVERFQSPD